MISLLQGRLVALVGVLGLIALPIADALDDHFWSRHSLITSLVANLAVIALTFGVVNEIVERQARRRWSGLAQFAMIELVRSSRVTWTFLVDLAGLLPAPDGRSPGRLLADSRAIAQNTEEVRRALAGVLADPQRRATVSKVLARIDEACREVIVSWAGVMVGQPAYAAMFDRHVELLTRVDWLSTLFTHYEGEDLTPVRRRVASSSIAVELTTHVDDTVMLNMLLSIVSLAVRLDEDTSAVAVALVPAEEWLARTADLTGQTGLGSAV
jgi:hypothetical protein